MPTAIALQHVPHEGPGTIADAAARRGWTLDIRHRYTGDDLPEASAVEALVVMGGPMGAYEEAAYPFLAGDIQLIKECLDRRTPVIGFCLGSQLIAKAAGARVYPAGRKEIGWYEVEATPDRAGDPVTGDMPDPLGVFHWHGDTFDLPTGATLLFTSSPIPHQAFRIGTNAYAFQFHIEITEAMIREWIDIGDAELAEVRGTIDPVQILDALPDRLPAMQAAGAGMLDRWFQLASQ